MAMRYAGWLLLFVATVAGQGCGSKSGDGAVTASIAGGASEPGTPQPPPIPRVVVRTTLGEFTIELDPEHAPLTVENFLNYVGRHHYDGTLFHQLEKDFILLGGGYNQQLQEKPTDAPVRNEAHNGLHNTRGTVAMARAFDSIDSACAQFFINLADNTSLDHQARDAEHYGYCVFGKVVAGMDVIDRIAALPTQASGAFEKLPSPPVAIESIVQAR